MTKDQQVVNATVTPTATGATVQYAISPVPPSGAVNNAKITFKDSDDVEIVSPWQFTITYLSLDPANRQPGPGKGRGFNLRVTIADPAYGPYENSLERAELQLAQPSTIPSLFDTNLVVQLMEMSQDGSPRGLFAKDSIVPGLEDGYYGTDDFAVEATAWLELAPGPYRFTVISDDGFKVSSGSKLTDKTPILGFRNGGTANEVTGTFEFLVTAGGFYPFRVVWYERGGDAYIEWSSVNLATGVRTLINDTDSPIKAYLDIAPAPAVKVQSSANVAAGYADDPTAVIDTSAKKITIPISGTMKFFRLIGGTALNITSTQVQGANLVLTYQ